MRYPVKGSNVKKLYPAAYAEALAALRSSSSKFKATPEKDLAFEWMLAVGIDSADVLNGALIMAALAGKSAGAKKRQFADVPEALRATDPQSYCDRKIGSGQFMVVLACAKSYASSRLAPGSACPAEIVAAYSEAPLAPAAPGAAILLVHHASGKLPGVHQRVISGGYVKDGVSILMDERGVLHHLDPAGPEAFFGGMLTRAARAAYDACPPGGVFRHRSKPFSRMTMAQVDAEIARFPVRSFDGVVGMPMLAVAAPALTGAEPVYAPGSMEAAVPVQVGTAASMGLRAAPSAGASPPAKAKV